jgi:hypothetical protein
MAGREFSVANAGAPDAVSARPVFLPANPLDYTTGYPAPAARLTASPAHWDLPTPLPNQDQPTWAGD